MEYFIEKKIIIKLVDNSRNRRIDVLRHTMSMFREMFVEKNSTKIDHTLINLRQIPRRNKKLTIRPHTPPIYYFVFCS